ncbi:Cation efflux system protein CusB [Pontiella desulfatans]|uniref:Cation efflux system protein CusB n=1 Tax=Pontiella desulfatans TaxID=2750659 RepID=A0A6C2U662_PONDE|nr:efflux RND transporter periplasmic adaptor subunit [Pontiella desulfatans]VGO15568.1 Cation efflux system protein CusB [Pontiella desulfatans]
MKTARTILVIALALGAGFVIRGYVTPSSSHPLPPSEQSAPETWTCSMHPQIQLPKQGKCPICFMDLIPLESGMDSGGEREIRVGDYAASLMELETTVVERRFAEAEIRMVGKVDYDETRVSTISAWVPGRIDRLFVDYTGMPVRAGDHLAEFYSPELVNAQKELLHAIRRSPEMVDAVREKFRFWGFDTTQIEELEKRGTATDHMTINATAGGIVIHRNISEGMYVETGTKLFTIADLSRVWILLDAYESDLNGLRYGSPVEFSTEAYPGETFEGTISFIAPMVNPMSRTAKVRVVVENNDGRLKPGMFVRAIARPRVADGGRVMDPDLAGKWISPMHPEVVKDGPGSCDVCGMPLVSAESLGYVAAAEANAPLLIPATAALKTGKRAVVYVEIPDQEKPTYEGREVGLGARLGDFYVVESGLEEGERVVSRGAFKLDAELQIQAKPSMMSFRSQEPRAQTHCPVMGNPVNKEVYVDHEGLRIYFCCPGCDSTFKEDPGKYLKQMQAAGVVLEQVEHQHAH